MRIPALQQPLTWHIGSVAARPEDRPETLSPYANGLRRLHVIEATVITATNTLKLKAGPRMDLFYGKVAAFLNLFIYVLIRWPHGKRMHAVTVVENRRGRLEFWLLMGATLGTTLLPIVWMASSLFAFADYSLHPVAFCVGLGFLGVGHWVFYRSHADLGTNWFVTLQVGENHKLVTSGIYARIRHPMYSAMILQGIAQVLVLPNWLVGPAWLVSFGVLYVFRVRHEEQMMLDQFGSDYENYMRQTGRLLPTFRRAD